ncbi:hypothetical protein ACIFOT_19580 [Neobacillus sp. NRS-1170]|uniref:hypothetical protein n=1 Tax=Neobacillus sp. NRS-1170 TaxID=3233898 RepID=UPI003D27016A
MFKILVIILIFVIVFAWEAPRLFRKKEKKELAVFSCLVFIGLVLSIAVVILSFI